MGRAGGLLVDGTAEEHLRIGALETVFCFVLFLAILKLMGGKTQSMSRSYPAEELTWRGRQARTLKIGPSHLTVFDARGRRTAGWDLPGIIDAFGWRGGLHLRVPCLCGVGAKSVVYSMSLAPGECSRIAKAIRDAVPLTMTECPPCILPTNSRPEWVIAVRAHTAIPTPPPPPLQRASLAPHPNLSSSATSVAGSRQVRPPTLVRHACCRLTGGQEPRAHGPRRRAETSRTSC